MRVIVLGGDGYLGWPTAMRFAARGHEVWAVDNYLRRQMALETCSEPLIHCPNLADRRRSFARSTGRAIRPVIGDCTDGRMMFELFADVRPDVVDPLRRAAVRTLLDDGVRRGQAHAAQQSRSHVQHDLGLPRSTRPTATSSSSAPWASTARPTSTSRKAGSTSSTRAARTASSSRARRARSTTPPRCSIPTCCGSTSACTGLRVTDLMQGPVYGLTTPEVDVGPAAHAKLPLRRHLRHRGQPLPRPGGGRQCR